MIEALQPLANNLKDQWGWHGLSVFPRGGEPLEGEFLPTETGDHELLRLSNSINPAFSGFVSSRTVQDGFSVGPACSGDWLSSWEDRVGLRVKLDREGKRMAGVTVWMHCIQELLAALGDLLSEVSYWPAAVYLLHDTVGVRPRPHGFLMPVLSSRSLSEKTSVHVMAGIEGGDPAESLFEMREDAYIPLEITAAHERIHQLLTDIHEYTCEVVAIILYTATVNPEDPTNAGDKDSK